MNHKKLTALILACLMMSMPLLSCSESAENKDSESVKETDSSSDTSSNTSEEISEPTTTYYNDMEAENFNGWTVNIAGGYGKLSDIDSVCEYITMEEITGDEFNDALYNRIIAVDDKYNVSVVTHDISAVDTAVKLSVTGGTQDFQLCADVFEFIPSLITGGYSIPITDIPTVDLDMPYWDQGAKEALMINGVMYYVLSDISFSHYDSTAVLFYNGVILNEYQIPESPYELYKDGRWTMDNMYNILETVATDTNGDGVMEYGEDLFGVIGRDLRYQPQLSASGVDVMRWNDEQQTFEICYTDETVVKVGDSIRKMLFDSNFADMSEKDAFKIFKAGKALFDSHLLGNFKGYRDLEDDYGIIPWPSVEENMEIKAYCRNPTALLIPAGQRKTEEQLGTVMSALAAYGYDYIIDNYINRTVIGKGARDRDSAEVIRSILDKRMYDVTYSFGLGSAAGGWEKALKNGSYASAEKTLSKVFKSTLKQALKPYGLD